MSQESKLHELEGLREKVSVLEADIDATNPKSSNWPPRQFYTLYYAMAGFALGGIGAMSSLLFNVVISFFVGQHPLHIIQVYLTIALGDSALTLNNSLTLVLGCLFYLMIGMVLGIPFHMILSRWFGASSMPLKLATATILSLAIWIVIFYGILSWLQPMLDGGNWILYEIPWWLAAATHVVYGWTMLAVQHLGRFTPPRQLPNAAAKAPVVAFNIR
jgi:hypothetical protein